MKEAYEMDQFLKKIHEVEREIYKLIQQSNLKDNEKNYILNQILVVPK